ncbi:hypothetical protein DAPPUDRAFT_314778 [Daphnia pulex]|uniref:C2H2-type domain-containing protein n=1 Tax=Daphnia pulex TaxID=6669 RepID=E9G7F7_DAPPU|nr:hypothetical protein DAPPUDRAFT_314778 [Daphnia pulex]|eukprot:EFX84651.1 hypothetical protein DAPPUDRAFT_314778 [Daphnia pulex]
MREIKCPVCLSLDYTSNAQLRRHLIRQHNSYGTLPKVLKCEGDCYTEMKGASSFIRHLREQHIFENTDHKNLNTATVSSSVVQSNSVEESSYVDQSNSVVNQDDVEELNVALSDINALEKTSVLSELKNKLKSEMSPMIFALRAKENVPNCVTNEMVLFVKNFTRSLMEESSDGTFNLTDNVKHALTDHFEGPLT